jgi:hypothetical protein
VGVNWYLADLIVGAGEVAKAAGAMARASVKLTGVIADNFVITFIVFFIR